MDVTTLDRDMTWLMQSEPLPLHPSWRQPVERSWLAKVIGAHRPLPKIGTLRMHVQALRLAIGYQQPIDVLLEEPFTIFLSRWQPTETAPVEVNLSLRPRRAKPGTEWLQLRTVWLHDHVDESVPQKQNFSPFISPAHFKRIYNALAGYAQVHGSRFPEGLRLDVDDATLIALESEGGLNSCTACGSLDVLPIAPETYRCGSCGYEGGDGLPRFIQERKRKRFDAMEPLERIESGLIDLIHAGDDLRAALSAEGDDEFDWLRGVLGARRRLLDAAYKLPVLREEILLFVEAIGPDGTMDLSWNTLRESLDVWVVRAQENLETQGGTLVNEGFQVRPSSPDQPVKPDAEIFRGSIDELAQRLPQLVLITEAMCHSDWPLREAAQVVGPLDRVVAIMREAARVSTDEAVTQRIVQRLRRLARGYSESQLARNRQQVWDAVQAIQNDLPQWQAAASNA